MTKRDYKEVARILNRIQPELIRDHQEYVDIWAELVNDMADFFGEENERFDFDKFYEACTQL